MTTKSVLSSLGGALAAAEFQRERLRVAPIEENIFGSASDLQERLQALDDGLVRRPPDPRGERFAGATILLVKGQKFANEDRDGARRNRHDLPAEADAVGTYLAAQQQLIVRRLPVLDL